ncbi:NF-kappa-B inhibitor delta-like, partial [Apteryx rowi]|uniref:NF-kappa-B inhibitor delta-like n=1 Tax=Apteryx rowi TaxID=308060 RepID=UPI000E1D37F1
MGGNGIIMGLMGVTRPPPKILTPPFQTPLLVAAAAAAAGVVGDLLALGADPDAADHRGRTILHLAATYGLPRILRAVMASGVPVNVEARNFE